MSSSHSKANQLKASCLTEARTKPMLKPKPMTFGEAMTLEKSNVIAKRHSANPLFLKRFSISMTFMTFNMWDVIYRGKRINVYSGIYKNFFIIYIGGSKNPNVIRHFVINVIRGLFAPSPQSFAPIAPHCRKLQALQPRIASILHKLNSL